MCHSVVPQAKIVKIIAQLLHIRCTLFWYFKGEGGRGDPGKETQASIFASQSFEILNLFGGAHE